MKVFLTGGSGYIGSAVALALKKAGHDVLALVRSEAKGEPLKKAGVKIAVGDLGNPAGYAGAAWGRAAFVNVAQDWSPQGPELDRKTIGSARDLLRGQVGATFNLYQRLLGAGADQWCRGRERAAQAGACGRLASRARTGSAGDGQGRHPLRRGATGHRLRRQPGRHPGHVLRTALKHGAAHTVGAGENHWPMVHIDDLAELYVRLVERAPAGSVYHAADASRLTQREVAESASRARARTARCKRSRPTGRRTTRR